MFRILRILVEIPALDRLLDRIDAAEKAENAQVQAKIDALTKRVNDLSARLKAALTHQ